MELLSPPVFPLEQKNPEVVELYVYMSSSIRKNLYQQDYEIRFQSSKSIMTLYVHVDTFSSFRIFM